MFTVAAQQTGLHQWVNDIEGNVNNTSDGEIHQSCGSKCILMKFIMDVFLGNVRCLDKSFQVANNTIL